MKKIVGLSVVLLFILSCPIWGDTDQIEKLKQSAQKGDAEAQFTLGLTYATGLGIPQNYEEAFKWIKQSADQEKPHAQDYLGTMYEEGKGVPQDINRAAELYIRAAEHGNANAQYNIGRFYAYGKGVHQNFTIAYMWLDLSSSTGQIEAIALKEKLEKLMKPEEIQEAKKMAQGWTPKK